MDIKQLTLDDALNQKSEILSSVADSHGDWIEDVLLMVRNLPDEWVGMGEDIRMLWEGEPPHHFNVWGATIRMAIKRKLIIPTGVWLPSRAAKSHAQVKRQYRKYLRSDDKENIL